MGEGGHPRRRQQTMQARIARREGGGPLPVKARGGPRSHPRQKRALCPAPTLRPPCALSHPAPAPSPPHALCRGSGRSPPLGSSRTPVGRTPAHRTRGRGPPKLATPQHITLPATRPRDRRSCSWARGRKKRPRSLPTSSWLGALPQQLVCMRRAPCARAPCGMPRESCGCGKWRVRTTTVTWSLCVPSPAPRPRVQSGLLAFCPSRSSDPESPLTYVSGARQGKRGTNPCGTFFCADLRARDRLRGNG